MKQLYEICGLAAILILLYGVVRFPSGSIIGGIKRYFTAPVLLVGIGLVVRFVLMDVNKGYENDIITFKAWASMLANGGLSSFYTSGQFTDYPPGYMYILWALGLIARVFSLSSEAFTALIKMPAILCDVLTALVIYSLAKKYLPEQNKLLNPFTIALLYLLNPAVILLSTVWGQVDALHTLLLLTSVYLMTEKKHLGSYLLLAYALIVKPQSLIVGPVFLYGVYDLLFESSRHMINFKPGAFQNLKRLALYIGIAVAFMIMLLVPFTRGLNFMPIINQYRNTLASYPYASVNAYNFYTFVGANWIDVNTRFLFMTYNAWGYLFILLTVLFALFILNKKRGERSFIFLAAAALYIFVYMFSVKMHERYIFPALAFMLVSYLLRPKKYILMFYGLFSVLLFVNCADVLYMLQNGNNISLISDSLSFVSTVYLVVTIAFGICLTVDAIGFNRSKQKEQSISATKLERYQPLFVALITATYAVVAFINLGNKVSPQSMYAPRNGEWVILRLEGTEPVSRVQYMTGPRHDQSFEIAYSPDNTTWSPATSINTGAVFSWGNTDLGGYPQNAFIYIRSNSDELMLTEMAFRDTAGRIMPVTIATHNGADPVTLFDEQGIVPENNTFMNSTYFDEIYHARTAYELLHKLPVYEWTHPPLGKNIMALGVKIFGMTPFGWRFMGTLVGVLMLPLIYLLARRMFKNTLLPTAATAMFALDFMHFAQTRIATIDVFVTFFVMLMYMFMYDYYSDAYSDEDMEPRRNMDLRSFARNELLPLLLCGISMGLAIAAKWQGIYGAIGLPVLFACAFFKRYPLRLQKYQLLTIAFCVFSFIVVPLIIYALSYGWYLQCGPFPAANLKEAVAGIIKNQKDMFGYHANLEATHPFSSMWFTWPVMIRPIYYFAGMVGNLNSGISSFGNPAIWWMGIASFLFCIRSLSKRFSPLLLFLIVAYLSQYLPWALISRTTYIYHYFPSVPFIILMTVYMFKQLINDRPTHSKWLYAYIGVAALLFVAFYPTISGMPVPIKYVDVFLKWMPSWILS